MKIKSTTNQELIQYLSGRGLYSLFPLYVCQRKPEAVSMCVLNENDIQGCLVTGRDCGLEWVHSHWMTANNRQTVQALLEHHKKIEGEDVCLNFPLEFHDEVLAIFPDKNIAVDHLYALIPSRFQKHQAKHPIEQITEKLLNQITVPDEMAGLIGSDYKAHDGTPFWAMIIDNQLVATGEAICDTGTYAAIQQVYTAESHRGQGLGSVMVSYIATQLIGQKKIPVYWVDENNDASIRIVQKLGFDLVTRLGCIED